MDHLCDAVLAVRAMDDASSCPEANMLCRSIGIHVPLSAWISTSIARIVQRGRVDDYWLFNSIVSRLDNVGNILQKTFNEPLGNVIDSTAHALHAVCSMVNDVAQLDTSKNESLQNCASRLLQIVDACITSVEAFMKWMCSASDDSIPQNNDKDNAVQAASFAKRVFRHRVGENHSIDGTCIRYSTFDHVAVLCCRFAGIADESVKERALQILARSCNIVASDSVTQSEDIVSASRNGNAGVTSAALAQSSALQCLAVPTWQSVAGTAEGAVELLCRIRYPDVCTRVLNVAIACALQLTDHHDAHFRGLGVQVVCHIVPNVLAADLTLSGQIHVIADLLQRLVYNNDVGEVEAVYGAYTLVLPILEPKPSMRSSTLHDKVLAKLLENIMCSVNPAKRRVYLQAAPPIVKLLGIGVAKHFKSVFDVISACLVVDDTHAEAAVVLACLRFIKVVVAHGWPRIAPRSRALLQRLRAVEGVWPRPDDGRDGKDGCTSGNKLPPTERQRREERSVGGEIHEALGTCITLVLPFVSSEQELK